MYKAPLTATLNAVLWEEGITQSGIANKIKVSQGEARLYAGELEKLDVLKRAENGHCFMDNVFRIWLDLRKTGELGNNPGDMAIEPYIKILERKYPKAKTGLGKAKESEVREKLMEISGIKFKPYLRDNIESDGVDVEDNYVNILEIKSRNKPFGCGDVKNFTDKIGRSEFSAREKRLFFVSKSGFTSQGFSAAKSDNIKTLNENPEEIK